MEQEIAIKVDKVYKDFRLPHERANSVKSLFTNLYKKSSQNGLTTQHALKNISFEVKKGEFFGIVGRNGSGKSTLLKIIAEIYRPTKGNLEKHGKLVPFIELGVGFNPELTGRENVYLSGALNGFSNSEIDEMYEDIVHFAELEEFMDQKLKNYSSGMQVRLAFSVATRSKADILLVDEVLAVGDADFQRKCFDYFKKLKKDKVTVVFVTHDMEAVREYCDRAMLIEKSEVIAMGSANSVSQEYLKLFTSYEHKGREGDQKQRWGDEKVRIEKATVDVHEKEIEITQKIIATEDVPGYMVGIRIRSATDTHLTGTNTKLEGLQGKPLVAGEQATLHWTMPNIFGEGDYYLDVAVQGEDGTEVYDWWDEAVIFTVQKLHKIPYSVDPGFTVKVK